MSLHDTVHVHVGEEHRNLTIRLNRNQARSHGGTFGANGPQIFPVSPQSCCAQNFFY